MYKCVRCKADNLIDGFATDSSSIRVVCIDCFIESPDPSAPHLKSTVCSVEGCTRLERGELYSSADVCQTHWKAISRQHLCKRCHNSSMTIDHLCLQCTRARYPGEIREYRKMGKLTELQKAMQELHEYRALGTYNRLADAVSRQDIDDHCDELDLPQK